MTMYHDCLMTMLPAFILSSAIDRKVQEILWSSSRLFLSISLSLIYLIFSLPVSFSLFLSRSILNHLIKSLCQMWERSLSPVERYSRSTSFNQILHQYQQNVWFYAFDLSVFFLSLRYGWIASFFQFISARSCCNRWFRDGKILIGF